LFYHQQHVSRTVSDSGVLLEIEEMLIKRSKIKVESKGIRIPINGFKIKASDVKLYEEGNQEDGETERAFRTHIKFDKTRSPIKDGVFGRTQGRIRVCIVPEQVDLGCHFANVSGAALDGKQIVGSRRSGMHSVGHGE
jgi:hypothetical protein